MKQLTSEPAVKRMSAGFALPVLRSGSAKRALRILRPEATSLPLDVEEWEIVADLDPGMLDWDQTFRR